VQVQRRPCGWHEAIAKSADVVPYQIAEAYAWRGEKDKAIEWLERADRQRDGKLACESLRRQGPDPESMIEERVGVAAPRNIAVSSWKRTKERLFIDELQRQVVEQYQPAFREVTALLEEHGFRRSELRPAA